MDQQLELDIEELQIKSKKEKHRLQVQMAQNAATIQALYESESGQMPATPSGTSTQYIIPTTTKKPNVKTAPTQPKLETQSPLPLPQMPQPALKTSFKKTPASSNDPIVDIMKRQNEISELMLKQQDLSQLPQRQISVFHGDPLQYKSFIKSFEQLIESKTDDAQQRLYFLEQYTAGEAQNLVRSYFHLPPADGFKEAKAQLEWHFGNPFKISSAFLDKAMTWPTIRSEDAVSLRSYVIFLKSCHNTMKYMNYVSDLEAPSSLKILASKLPFKLRDRWRSVACNIYDKHKQRPTFNDLIAFMDKQSRTMLDPIFGELLSPLTQKTLDGTTAPQQKGSSQSPVQISRATLQHYCIPRQHHSITIQTCKQTNHPQIKATSVRSPSMHTLP